MQSYSGGDGGRCRVTMVVVMEGGVELQWW